MSLINAHSVMEMPSNIFIYNINKNKLCNVVLNFDSKRLLIVNYLFNTEKLIISYCAKIRKQT